MLGHVGLACFEFLTILDFCSHCFNEPDTVALSVGEQVRVVQFQCFAKLDRL